MGEISIEYAGGPFDGRRQTIRTMPTGEPPRWRAEVSPELYLSALDRRPVVPAQVHRYELDSASGAVGDGPVRYRWAGPFG